MPTVNSLALKRKALGELGVTTIGQEPENDDLLRIEGYVSPLLSTLAAQEIIYVGDREQIPDSVYLQLAVLLAHAAQTEFSVSEEEAQKLEVRKMTAVSEIRSIMRGKPTYQPFRMESL